MDPHTRAACTTPIVAVLYDWDPVESSLVSSYSRPGGNLTGIFMRQPELIAKQLELLKEALPALSSVAVFWDGLGPRQLEDVKAAAQSLAVPLNFIELRVPYDFPAAFKPAKPANASAVLVLVSPTRSVQWRAVIRWLGDLAAGDC